MDARAYVETLRPFEEWIKLGYRANYGCYKPGGKLARERVRRGECSYSCATCKGPLRVCEVCGLPYCEYHFPKHRRF